MGLSIEGDRTEFKICVHRGAGVPLCALCLDEFIHKSVSMCVKYKSARIKNVRVQIIQTDVRMDG